MLSKRAINVIRAMAKLKSLENSILRRIEAADKECHITLLVMHRWRTKIKEATTGIKQLQASKDEQIKKLRAEIQEEKKLTKVVFDMNAELAIELKAQLKTAQEKTASNDVGKARDLLEEWYSHSRSPQMSIQDTEECIQEVIQLLNDTPSPWTKVEDGLPEEDQSVLCFQINFKEKWVGTYCDKYSFTMSPAYRYQPTHWTPIPELPKEEGGEIKDLTNESK